MSQGRIYRRSTSVLLLILVVIAVFALGYTAAGYVNAATNSKNSQSIARPNLDTYWRIWDTLSTRYPFKDKIPTSDKAIDGAIKGMVASFNDPYTVYFTKPELKSFQSDIKGSFFGIGAELGKKDNQLSIIAPIKNSPAEKAGLKSGDVIYKIDDKLADDLSVEEAIALIRGEDKTVVNLTIIRKGEKKPLQLAITRGKIELPVVEVTEKNGVITVALYSFTEQSMTKMYEALAKAKDKSTKGVILDLRGNPGGILDGAIEISSLFLPKGTTIVKEKPNPNNPTKGSTLLYKSRGYGVVPDTLPVVVIIDGGSASASEIVAGALQANKRAKLIGAKSFGKGSVQEVIQFPDGSGLKMTVAKWYTPNDISISDSGLTPDVIYEDATPNNKIDDVQEKALSMLFKK